MFNYCRENLEKNRTGLIGIVMGSSHWIGLHWFDTLRPRQNDRHFPDDIFKCIFLNENMWIFIEISLKFVLKGLINNIPALVQIMTWRRPGDKPLSAPMMVYLLTHICVTRPQWVNDDTCPVNVCVTDNCNLGVGTVKIIMLPSHSQRQASNFRCPYDDNSI